MKKRIINIFLILSILSLIIWIEKEQYKDNNIQSKRISHEIKNSTVTRNNDPKEIQKKINIKDKKQYPKETIIEEYKGYEVSAKLEIAKISLETYILKNYSKEALNISPTKFWGPNANEEGNFCIAGHNFQNNNMFQNIKKLQKGDRIFLSDNKIGKVEYEIYDIYNVIPEDTSCLSQETNGKKEITLITCTNDSKKRIIVKAHEVEGEI